MAELSIFIDESGMQEGKTKFYLVTLVAHDQSKDISGIVADYERSLAEKGLPNIPFHASPLMRAHDAYSHMDVITRKRLMASFRVFVQNLPVSYRTFVYKSKEFGDAERLQALIKKDLVAFLVDNLSFFQSFDKVKIYYDEGQRAVKNALRGAFSFVLSKEALVFREPDYRSFRLVQVADYLCEIERAAVKYETHEETGTDERFYGGSNAFKKNFLKQARRKLLVTHAG